MAELVFYSKAAPITMMATPRERGNPWITNNGENGYLIVRFPWSRSIAVASPWISDDSRDIHGFLFYDKTSKKRGEKIIIMSK